MNRQTIHYYSQSTKGRTEQVPKSPPQNVISYTDMKTSKDQQRLVTTNEVWEIDKPTDAESGQAFKPYIPNP